ncbi:MotA/TolQ/ExbB proton channel family protein [Ruminococcus flavefaciens]|jgi:chemotaxis protein MotA|uniref:MotA/TolQ/ExbB proton channel family protein n=1 Tax=Ruminococcus flavefaciens TaxID=1265 RepID=UPI0013DD55F8|nr:MotA/TolQ/ExbB proton channel family protein [Ruminococcus flavefaciens]
MSWSKLGHSIINNDSIILMTAVLTLIFFFLSFFICKKVNKININNEKNPNSIKILYALLSAFYTIFITLISIFPLLGMGGTVLALLKLDMVNESAISNAQNNFFDALTSTMWGIIFAIFFKTFNAIFATYIEDSISRLSDYLKKRGIK